MRNHADWRSRARSLVRHAAAAAGLGVGWLLLSGGAASAAAPPPGDLLGSVVAPPVAAASSPGHSTPSLLSASVSTGALGKRVAGTLPRTTAALTSDPVGTVAGLAAGATTSTASELRALPGAVEPLTNGPLAPLSPVLAPVVSGTAGALGSAVDAVGSAAQDVAHTTTAVLPAPRVEVPVPVPAPVPAHPAPVAAQAGGTPDLPGTADAVPAAEASRAATGSGPRAFEAVPADSSLDSTTRSLLTGPFVSAALMVDAAASAVLPDDPAPSFPTLPWLPATAGSVDGGLLGPGGSGPSPAALAAAGFALALAWRAGPRVHPRAVRVPALPAFDPGSTPD
ncbi:hypothetical protein J2W21_000705 [Sinomonas atrocyanea]|uniref:hypothetical protein n=1 Tax=Sinomonas atrocyanea TaxID=37927 RepID=UPI0027880B1F|nr:hypothetical protein [Sinomonas atrocyanea]MDP9883215.1 hypothetical protein [Sinomonas atrocyanea]